MKKTILTLSAALLVTAAAVAQHCPQASVNIPTRVGTTAGLTPLPEDLPCMVVGQTVSDTIYFHNFSTVYFGATAVTIDSLKIDSIGNLPDGLCWVSNKASNNFAGNEDGIIYVNGTCTGAPGQYKLRILFEAQTSIGNLPPYSDAETYAGLRYYVRAKCALDTCPNLDTVAGASNFYLPYTACPGPPPAIITALGAVTFCQGSSVILSASNGGHYTYRWSTGATTDSITVTTGGSYVVTVYNGTDSTVSAPTVVTVHTLPNPATLPAGVVTVCQGDTTILSVNVPNLHYHWSNNDTTQNTNTTTGGTYSVTVTNNNGCSAVSLPITITANPLPAAVILRNGSTLTAGSGTGYTYQWYKDGTLLTGETAITLSITTNGSYTVLVTNANNCHALSAPLVITNVGIHDINGDLAIRLYPNPSEGLLTLESNGRMGDKYEIYDELGRSIQQRTITSDKMLIDMSTQLSGVYYMTVKHGAANETLRFVLMK